MIVDDLIEHVVASESQLLACSERLKERSDGEALHDLRVTIRQLRSVLRPLRGFPGIGALEGVAAEIGHRSTHLRDTEVLLQELDSRGLVELSAARRQALESGCDALLSGSEWLLLRSSLAAWPAICHTAKREGQLKELRRHIRKQLAKQQRKLGKCLRDPDHDRHRLRVLIKRVRYADEVYPALSDLPGKASKRLKAAQAALGDWHDRVQWLSRAEREADLQALRPAWQQALAEAERRSDEALAPLLEDFPAD